VEPQLPEFRAIYALAVCPQDVNYECTCPRSSPSPWSAHCQLLVNGLSAGLLSVPSEVRIVEREL